MVFSVYGYKTLHFLRVCKIALFDKALVLALARGALAMCVMWVGFCSSFFAGGEKKTK